jgi:hypothetical protein
LRRGWRTTLTENGTIAINADKTLEELFKFRLAQLRADGEDATSTISQGVRVIAYGLVALFIPFVSSEPNKIPVVVQHYPLMLARNLIVSPRN